METTIQVTGQLMEKLKSMKISDKESYETVIWDLIEDSMELSKEAKANIAKSEREIREGKTASLEEIKRKIKMRNV